MTFKKIALKNAMRILFTSVSLLTFSLSSCTKNSDAGIINTAADSSANASAAAIKTRINTASAAAVYTTSGVISLSNVHDITISGKSIAGGSAPCIYLNNCYNIIITGNKLYNSTDVGIHLLQCHNISITKNYITNVSTGVYADHCPGGIIQVHHNQFLNMQGPMPRGQFVQFDNVGGRYNSIGGNVGENIMGQSQPIDAISLYQSSGTASSPITINNNQILGGGPSSTGGGIMLGDGGGSYLSASGNTLVNPGQYGIAIAGGSNNSIINNTIYGKAQSFTNIGLYVDPIGAAISNATVSGNKVLFYNSSGVQNDAWLAPGVATPAGWSTNLFGAPLSASILPANIITDN